MTEEEFLNEEGMTANEVMRILKCSRSLLSTPEMKIALGAFRVGKSGIRFKKTHVKRLMDGDSMFVLLKEQEQYIKYRATKIESRLGLWQ
ncbi:MAG: hypothetical protein EOM03_06240 [Clostridia bacterium]|nr:hypothetical protein [Clostridia bacterium]